MAKVTGGMMSLDASGKFAGTMVFSKWKGRPYARLLVTPANPNTAGQQGVRANMRWLGKRWAGLTDPQKATWDARATQNNYSPFNAFVSVNQADFAQGFGDQREDPAEASNPPNAPTAPASSVTGNQVTLTWTDPGTGDVFGVIVWLSQTTGFTPGPANVKDVVDATVQSSTISGLASGTWYYRIAGFDYAGIIGTLLAQGSFVIA
jgi:hypothetical protein